MISTAASPVGAIRLNHALFKDYFSRDTMGEDFCFGSYEPKPLPVTLDGLACFARIYVQPLVNETTDMFVNVQTSDPSHLQYATVSLTEVVKTLFEEERDRSALIGRIEEAKKFDITKTKVWPSVSVYAERYNMLYHSLEADVPVLVFPSGPLDPNAYLLRTKGNVPFFLAVHKAIEGIGLPNYYRNAEKHTRLRIEHSVSAWAKGIELHVDRLSYSLGKVYFDWNMNNVIIDTSTRNSTSEYKVVDLGLTPEIEENTAASVLVNQLTNGRKTKIPKQRNTGASYGTTDVADPTDIFKVAMVALKLDPESLDRIIQTDQTLYATIFQKVIELTKETFANDALADSSPPRAHQDMTPPSSPARPKRGFF
ncbi:hypothetical protein CYMTET_47722 [Cymbomonas tetramitiformis]|uniref:Uncharacterized protein n=1 Tax=Cymbomonas tetramitiformis TaxID=36881 RepID=A0AAE0BTJ2_9CHLO|nr:hypothetical protein CYMTET_47722 [Cymbomonas tetramitiformis]|eukprot:gene4527-5544_t